MGDHWKWKKGQKPKVLKSKDLSGLANYIQSNKCSNIVLMGDLDPSHTGVSTSAGIPDFRSPKTGAPLHCLESNLARLNLPHPEAVFEIGFFRRNPVPFYTLAQELYPGKFRPTPAHPFIRLLHDKGLLLKCFTQNIDTLERRAGVPDHKIIEAHGSFATQRCIQCQAPYDDDLIRVHIKEKTIPRCDGCLGLVKPDIVFFGESLPPEFMSSIPMLQEADLLIVMGTSLTVHPFAMLAGLVEDKCPRVLINLERVGDFANRADDVVLLGKCDEMVRDLCKELGWEEELEELWSATEDSVEKDEVELGKDEKTGVDDEIDTLTAAIEHSLALSSEEKSSSLEKEADPPKSKGKVLEIPESKVPPTDASTEQADVKAGDASKEEGKL
ncbi:NAD-dependent deacetylase sirtuin-2 [Macrolepiota fuliginosa MF-IS2]|uniref:NAD-dependent protein deacetylase n=1 Tax=Macrolepiota fuliginosa MF-IS2 TaxID=1400762 RepID=A0A9P5XFZ7_9AGAR|nr:NAD-dependent deacetylase sirtuin-2 [Macrolepiota fuliginosa MF-IS2]